MLEIIPKELISNIHIFLDLNSKKSLRLSNKSFNNIIKSHVYAHIGNILSFKIGLDFLDKGVIRQILNEMSKKHLINFIYKNINNHFFYKECRNHIKFKFKSINSIKIGVLYRITSKTRIECINQLLSTKKIFRRFSNSQYYSSFFAYKHHNKTLYKKLPLTYSLLLANPVSIY